MKRLLLAMILVASNVQAEPSTVVWLQLVVPSFLAEAIREDKFDTLKPATVTATGTGKTCEQALSNAKQNAIGKAIGVWIHGERSVYENEYKESIIEYSGGLIQSYKILSDQCTRVEIEAVVVPRKNAIRVGSAHVTKEIKDTYNARIENEKQRQIAINKINDRSKAFVFDIKEMELFPEKIVVVGELSYQEKWKYDYQELLKQAGQFNLDSFYKPFYVELRGYNIGKEIFRKRYQLNYEIDMYSIAPTGYVRIYPYNKDTIKLTFPISSGIIMNIDKFEVAIL